MLVTFFAAAAAAAAASEPVDIRDPKALVSFMQANGYQAELDTSGKAPEIRSGAAGARFYIYFQGCKDGKDCQDLLFQAAWDSETGKEPPLDKINAFNRDRRFVRAYVDKEKDPIVEMDVVFTGHRMNGDMLAEHFEIWSDMMGQFVRDVVSVQEE